MKLSKKASEEIDRDWTGEGVAGEKFLLIPVTGLASTLCRRGRGPKGSPDSTTAGG